MGGSQDVAEQTMEDLAKELRRIHPPVFPIHRKNRASRRRSAPRALCSHSRPSTFADRACRRVGNTNREMPADECNRMLLEALHASCHWETEPVHVGR